MRKLMFLTAGLSLLAATAAFAQSEPATPPAQTPADGSMTPTSSSVQDPGAAAAPTAQPGSSVRMVTNGPVPDTPDMRAKYPPNSNAGKRTKAAGN